MIDNLRPIMIPNFFQTFQEDTFVLHGYYTGPVTKEGVQPPSEDDKKKSQFRAGIAAFRVFSSLLLAYNALKTITNFILISGAPLKFAEAPLFPLFALAYRVMGYLVVHDIFTMVTRLVQTAPPALASNIVGIGFNVWGAFRTEGKKPHVDHQAHMTDGTFFQPCWKRLIE